MNNLKLNPNYLKEQNFNFLSTKIVFNTLKIKEKFQF